MEIIMSLMTWEHFHAYWKIWPISIPCLPKDKYSRSQAFTRSIVYGRPPQGECAGHLSKRAAGFPFPDFRGSSLDSSLISLTQQIFNQPRYVKMWFLQWVDLSGVLELKCVFSFPLKSWLVGKKKNQIFNDILCLSDKMFWRKSSKLEIKSLLKVILHSWQSDTLSD